MRALGATTKHLEPRSGDREVARRVGNSIFRNLLFARGASHRRRIVSQNKGVKQETAVRSVSSPVSVCSLARFHRRLHLAALQAAKFLSPRRSLSEKGFLCATLWNLCASVVELLRKNQPQRHRDRTEKHRVYFSDRLRSERKHKARGVEPREPTRQSPSPRSGRQWIKHVRFAIARPVARFGVCRKNKLCASLWNLGVSVVDFF